ncbi:MAG: DNA repair protein RecO [Pseudomonadales bacterium]
MTTSNQELVPAYILHSRKYRDTSLILELFTEIDGRVAGVQRGARGKKQSATVQPFTPILVSYMGKGELKTITKIDAGSMQHLTGDRLLLGMYANELLIRLLGKYEPTRSLFQVYQRLLINLAALEDYQGVLRDFELKLLEELGYGISFAFTAGSGDMVEPEQHYRFVADEGFHPIAAATNSSFPGAHLLAIADGEYNPEVERTARRITRSAINRLLGDRPLQSRELFKQLNRSRQQ